MNRIIRNIRVSFLFVAILAVNLHMIIPHDHHVIESVVSQEESCPATNPDSGHHSGLPIHCHAFNDLAAEKSTSFLILRNIQCRYFVSSNISDLTSIKIHTSWERIFDLSRDLYNSDLTDFSQLRAPPSVS